MSLPAEAKSNKKEPKVIGYEYKYVRMKVRIAKKKYLGKFYITHYCPCSKCCGAEGGKVTASGTKPTAGRTVGVNPNLISYGTKLKVGNTRGYIAEDTGGGIGWKHLDIYCNSHSEALNAGVGWEKVYAIKVKYKKRKIKVKVPIFEEVENERKAES
jgi:3D (Asp-Asp-Asp) domain-containing protein